MDETRDELELERDATDGLELRPQLRVIKLVRPAPPSFREMAAFAELARVRTKQPARPARVRPLKSLLRGSWAS